jgi:hypothetical protein
VIRAIPYQDPRQEAERLRAVHEARVKIVPSLSAESTDSTKKFWAPGPVREPEARRATVDTSTVLGHANALVFPTLAAHTALHVGGVGAVLKILSAVRF